MLFGIVSLAVKGLILVAGSPVVRSLRAMGCVSLYYVRFLRPRSNRICGTHDLPPIRTHI